MVVVDERGLSKALDALPSVFAPVWAAAPAWRKADPASERWTALDAPLWRVLPASEATPREVDLVCAEHWKWKFVLNQRVRIDRVNNI